MRNKKAAAMLRVSSFRQKDNNSHQLQEERIRQYAKDNGLELVAVYKLVESAKKAEDRKQNNKALEECLRGDVYNILWFVTDREARNLTDNEKNEYLVKADQIAIHYVNNGKILHKDSSTSDFLVRDMEAITNKNFVRVLSEKVTDAMVQKAESGWYPGNHPPLGYAHQRLKDDSGREKKRGTIIVPNPDERMVRLVQREFELRAKGHIIDQILEKNRSEGFVPSFMQHRYTRRGIELPPARERGPFLKVSYN